MSFKKLLEQAISVTKFSSERKRTNKKSLSTDLPERNKSNLYSRIRVVASLLMPLIVASILIDTAQASAGLNIYAQQRGDDVTVSQVLGCLGLVIILAGLILRFTYPGFAPSHNQTINSSLPMSQIWTEIDTVFPKRAPAGRPWARKHPKEDPNTLQLLAYPLPYWGGCLIMLMTGILLGAIGWGLMGRLDKVIIRPIKTDEGSTIQIGASGYAAVAKAKELAAILSTHA